MSLSSAGSVVKSNARESVGPCCPGYFARLRRRVPTRVRAHTWTGWHASLAVDVRFWVAKHWALQIAPTAVFGLGTDSGSEVGYYLRREAGFVNLEGCFGALFAP